MVDLRRKCPQCARQFRPPKGTSRRYCESCRPPRALAGSVGPEPLTPPAPFVGEVGTRVRAALGDIDAADLQAQVAATLAIRLAAFLDDPRLPGGQASSLARQIEELTAKATRNVKPPADFVDDMAARRRA